MFKRSDSSVAIPPGESIKEQLLYRRMSQKEFATRMDMSEKHISKLLNGEVQLTSDVAIRLEMVLSVPAKYWSRLESLYRETLILIDQENGLDDDIELLKTIPYKKLSDLGWVPETKDKHERVSNLRKFFEVVDLTILKNSNVYQIIGKDLDITKKKDAFILACIQRSIVLAREIQSKPFTKREMDRIIKAIDQVVASNPTDLYPQIKQVLETKGILLVETPIIEKNQEVSFSFKFGNRIVIGDSKGNDYLHSLYTQLAYIKFHYVEKGNCNHRQIEQWISQHINIKS